MKKGVYKGVYLGKLNRLPNGKTQFDALGVGKYCDGGGLWLVKRADGGGQWILRYSLYSKRYEIALGGLSKVSLKSARAKAVELRRDVSMGKDPKAEKRKGKLAAQRSSPTLNAMFADTFEARRRQLKDDGKAGRWKTALRLHVLPTLGKMHVEEITQNEIKQTLAPIWHEKRVTARKAINRLGIVLRHAAAAGYDVDLQAVIKAKALLGAQDLSSTHIPSMPWQEVPGFYQSLKAETICHLALRLTILTACRSGEVRYIQPTEINNDVWVVPEERMKGGVEHCVPLSQEAMAVIEEAKKFERDGFLFPNKNKGVISDMTMSRYMTRLGLEARPHGFRSSFRTWCAEATDTPREVAETALAHVAGGKVERSYLRTDFLEQRRVLMERWADHVLGGSGQVVRMRSL
jgi:integrase